MISTAPWHFYVLKSRSSIEQSEKSQWFQIRNSYYSYYTVLDKQNFNDQIKAFNWDIIPRSSTLDINFLKS